MDYELTDNTIAEEGIDVRAERFGKYVGTFRVKFVDPYDLKVEKHLNAIRRRHAILKKVKELSHMDGVIVVLAEYALLGWQDIKLADGTDVPFSSEEAIEYLSVPKNAWIVIDLANAANNGENFQAVEEFDPAKN